MITKAEIQLVQSLQQKKYRMREQLFIAEGEKIVGELLQSDFKIHSIYALAGWIEKNKKQLNQVRCEEVNEVDLKKISTLSTPNEVLCVVKMKHSELNFADLKNSLTLALDDVQDPGNFGTLIRIADWFGIERILCSEQTVDFYNPKVIQASMGSFLRSSVFYGDLNEAIDYAENAGTPVYAAVLDGENIYTKQHKAEGIIVLGNESKGISEALKSKIKNKLYIPSFSHQKTDSLNVSIAAAIFCSEFKRNTR